MIFHDLPFTKIYEREEKIIEECASKNVFHIGATNYPYHIEAAGNGELLHQKLNRVCKKNIGIDISKEGINYLKEKYNIGNIFEADICDISSLKPFLKEQFDIIVIGEVIEHLTNPGLALDTLAKFSGLLSKKPDLLFTVPNYMSYMQIKSNLQRKELVHPDHNFWFSYVTFTNFLKKYGFRIVEFQWCTYGKSINPIVRFLLAIYPNFSDVVFVRCKVERH